MQAISGKKNRNEKNLTNSINVIRSPSDFCANYLEKIFLYHGCGCVVVCVSSVLDATRSDGVM